MKKYILCITFMLVCVMLAAMYRADYENRKQEAYTSPQGTNTITVKYDFVSRPSVYKKRGFWNSKIWDYPNSGFMETVHFKLEWLSENQIRFTYSDIENHKYDEEYIITIPD